MNFFRLSETLLASAVVVSLGALSQVQAASVTPEFQNFGDLKNATSTAVEFGGKGIPTDPSAYSTFVADNGDELTLGVTAHQRFTNPPLGNDGAGTFTAQAGANNGTPPQPGTASTWNFAWFAEVTGQGGSTLDDFGVQLLYDLDSGVGTDEADLGVWDLGTTIAFFQLQGNSQLQGNLFQSSQNATFGFLGMNDAALGLTAPAFTAFNPFAAGEYSFALRSSLGQVAINVNVAAVPLPAAGLLLLGALGGLGAVARRRKAAV